MQSSEPDRFRSIDLYLDLLQKTLLFELWDEPWVPVRRHPAFLHGLKGRLLRAVDAGLRRLRLGFVYDRRLTDRNRREGTFWPVHAHTMTGRLRLDQLREATETVLREAIPGDFIEAGVWRGGSCLLMRGILKAWGVTDRRVFVADSFAGLPPPDAQRYPQDRGDVLHRFPALAIPEEQVRENFHRYGLLDDQVVFLKGFFEETLPTAPVANLAILRLDGDMYGSTMVTLENLYPKLSPGGYCIVDDYALRTCQQAVDDYRSRHRINEPLLRADWTGVYWRKSRTVPNRDVPQEGA
ncbi:MAG TPA: macrocin O-methyltransferase [Planctomycetaceae bacterium]|nr:macrocin O-methyltransferase [Planctomycetaceae bacterium]